MTDEILKSIQTNYVDAQTLLSLLQDYKKPWDWIGRQIKAKKLIRIKNGLYAIGEREISKPQLANFLYGPSYVSLHWALSFYGLIPERSVAITSVTSKKKNKSFHTPLGHFTYAYLNLDRYCISYDLTDDHFLIATPEKALIDFVYFYCEAKTVSELLEELIESYRFTVGDIKNLNFNILKSIANGYHSQIINILIKGIDSL